MFLTYLLHFRQLSILAEKFTPDYFYHGILEYMHYRVSVPSYLRLGEKIIALLKWLTAYHEPVRTESLKSLFSADRKRNDAVRLKDMTYCFTLMNIEDCLLK